MLDTNESETLVSVVIPTYERQEYLRGAIQTALGQTYDPIEVIVVDDGSSEPYAAEIVADFPESVMCIRHDKNQGLSAARNTGIQAANGEYIAFLDDDDRWNKDKIGRQVSILSEHKEAGLATCLVVSITPNKEIVHCEPDAPSGDCLESMLIGNQIGTPSKVLVRKDCFDNIGFFDESLPTKQDWDLYIRLCKEWSVVAISDYLCFRTIHESMSSSSRALERDKKKILQKHKDVIKKKGMWKQARSSVDEEIGRSYLQENLNKARKYLRRSLSVVTSRRLVLLSLSYTHPVFVNKCIRLKRLISRYKSDCSRVSVASPNIPGLWS
jgi:glycosyltransferase involved in cell wall biosynthesis